MNKKDLVDALKEKSSYVFTLEALNELVDIAMDEMSTALKKGKPVRLVGFGTLHPKTINKRTYTLPDGETVIQAKKRKSVRFSPSKKLLEILN